MLDENQYLARNILRKRYLDPIGSLCFWKDVTSFSYFMTKGFIRVIVSGGKMKIYQSLYIDVFRTFEL